MNPKVHNAPSKQAPLPEPGPSTMGTERSSGFFFGKFSLVIFIFIFENHEVLVFFEALIAKFQKQKFIISKSLDSNLNSK